MVYHFFVHKFIFSLQTRAMCSVGSKIQMLCG